MAFRIHKPYVLTDIEPVIAVADAIRWERQNVQPPHQPVLGVDKFAEARRVRSAYQRELIMDFGEAAVAWLFSLRPRSVVAKTPRRG
jgi:hypothetical protein